MYCNQAFPWGVHKCPGNKVRRLRGAPRKGQAEISGWNPNQHKVGQAAVSRDHYACPDTMANQENQRWAFETMGKAQSSSPVSWVREALGALERGEKWLLYKKELKGDPEGPS